MIKKTCGSCGLHNPKKNICALNNRSIDPAADFCSQHAETVIRCQYCGHITMSPIIDTTGKNMIILCQNCHNQVDTCNTCIQSYNCAFNEDPSPIPHMIERHIRQGPMTAVVQEKNPERIAITCKVSCECFDEEIGCRREVDKWCDKYKQLEGDNAT